MAALAVRAHADKALTGVLEGDALATGQLGGFRLHECAGQAGDGVGNCAAIKLDEPSAGKRLGAELAVIDALLAADDREVGVGREAERGLGIAVKVVGHVSHARLLVVADDAAEGVRELLARLLNLAAEEVGRVEGEDEGALVVQDAAADEVAVLAGDVQCGEGPAQAKRHDVGVGDGGYIRVGLAGHVSKADVAVKVGDLKAKTGGNALSGNEGLVCLGAKGLAGLGRLEVLDGLDLDQGADVLDDVLPNLLDILVNLLL